MHADAVKEHSGMVRGLGTGESRRVRPSSTASRDAAASNVPSVVSQPPFGTEMRRIQIRMCENFIKEKNQHPFHSVHDNKRDIDRHSQIQLSGLFQPVITSTFPAACEMGIATQTVRGVERFLLIIEYPIASSSRVMLPH